MRISLRSASFATVSQYIHKHLSVSQMLLVPATGRTVVPIIEKGIAGREEEELPAGDAQGTTGQIRREISSDLDI